MMHVVKKVVGIIQNLANTYIHYMGHKSGDLNCPVLWLEFLMSPFVYVRWDIFFIESQKGGLW